MIAVRKRSTTAQVSNTAASARRPCRNPLFQIIFESRQNQWTGSSVFGHGRSIGIGLKSTDPQLVCCRRATTTAVTKSRCAMKAASTAARGTQSEGDAPGGVSWRRREDAPRTEGKRLILLIRLCFWTHLGERFGGAAAGSHKPDAPESRNGRPRSEKYGTVTSNSFVSAIATEALASTFPEQGDVIGLRRTAFHSG